LVNNEVVRENRTNYAGNYSRVKTTVLVRSRATHGRQNALHRVAVEEEKPRSTTHYLEIHRLELNRWTRHDVYLKALDRDEWRERTARCAGDWKDKGKVM